MGSSIWDAARILILQLRLFQISNLLYTTIPVWSFLGSWNKTSLDLKQRNVCPSKPFLHHLYIAPPHLPVTYTVSETTSSY